MAKTNKKDKEKPSGLSESAKASNIPKPTTTPTSAKGSHINPKVTPQVPKGAVLSQQPGSGLAKAIPLKAATNANNANNSNTKVPAKMILNTSGGNTHAKLTTVARGNSFHIPKGGDKRGRDPLLGSKSGQSIVPPPTKQPRTYASATKGRDLHRVQDQQWPDFQLRVYKNNTYHEHLP
jgi:hypothetical protein